MIIQNTKFQGLKILKIKKFKDKRGDILKILNNNVKNFNFNCYESYLSFSKKGSVRGLHGQKGKYSQSKLIYCLKGEAIEIAVDLRKNSKTYGKIFKKKISDKKLIAIFFPKGFVHGVVILKENTILLNYNSKPYNKNKEFGININSLGLKFPKIRLLMSKKDKNLISLNEFISS